MVGHGEVGIGSAGTVNVILPGAGPPLAAREVMDARRPSAPGQQRVHGVDAGDGVTVVDSVAGHVRLGVPAPTTPGQPGSTPGVTGEQSVTDVRANGAVRVIRGVGGDVEIGP